MKLFFVELSRTDESISRAIFLEVNSDNRCSNGSHV
jgi:hypothetical protein